MKSFRHNNVNSKRRIFSFYGQKKQLTWPKIFILLIEAVNMPCFCLLILFHTSVPRTIENQRSTLIIRYGTRNLCSFLPVFEAGHVRGGKKWKLFHKFTLNCSFSSW